jgi:hypothetical protein
VADGQTPPDQSEGERHRSPFRGDDVETAWVVVDQGRYRGSVVEPIKTWRPRVQPAALRSSTGDCPRRMSPQAGLSGSSCDRRRIGLDVAARVELKRARNHAVIAPDAQPMASSTRSAFTSNSVPGVSLNLLCAPQCSVLTPVLAEAHCPDREIALNAFLMA